VTVPPPAVEDTNWLDGEGELYLRSGPSVEIDRPIYQGDVFANVPILRLPKRPPADNRVTLDLETTAVMVVPHPCQCYYGDNLRPYLTVAPVKAVDHFDNFGPDRNGAKDKFALLDLPLPDGQGGWVTTQCVGDFGRMLSLPSQWLKLDQRVACLTHRGLGLLAKRVLGFQLRYPTTLAQTMAYTQAEWNEAPLMQEWVRTHEGKLRGFTDWMTTPRAIPGVSQGDELIVPRSLRLGGLDVLLAMITSKDVEERPG